MGKVIPLFLSIILSITSYAQDYAVIETERTLWVPWTLEYTHQWEDYEEKDQERLFFRRNEYFENHTTLGAREENWLRFHHHLKEHFGAATPFPPLGYAILRKSDEQLIGSLVLKFSPISTYMDFGYGFCPEVRSQKFGQEVMARLLKLAHETQNQPLISFKDQSSRESFAQAWQWQGGWMEPNWPQLLSYFSPKMTSFQGWVASVDIDNPASMAVVSRQGMIPIGSFYNISNVGNRAYYDVDIFFQYPLHLQPVHIREIQWVEDILSRDHERIHQAKQEIFSHYGVPSDGYYKNFNRPMRQYLNTLNFLFYSSKMLRLTDEPKNEEGRHGVKSE